MLTANQQWIASSCYINLNTVRGINAPRMHLDRQSFFLNMFFPLSETNTATSVPYHILTVSGNRWQVSLSKHAWIWIFLFLISAPSLLETAEWCRSVYLHSSSVCNNEVVLLPYIGRSPCPAVMFWALSAELYDTPMLSTLVCFHQPRRPFCQMIYHIFCFDTMRTQCSPAPDC